jgi:histidyl-tRNA synthetase
MMLAGDELPAPARSLDLFVALDSTEARRTAFGLLQSARSAGLSAQMELAGRSLKGQLGQADALGARYVAIVDDGSTMLKDMQDGGQESIATDTVVHSVLRGLRTL